MSQWFFTAVSAHDFLLAGASPNHSATAALAFGEMMWFIHRYPQFGCLAFDEIIQVSDQPVAPSVGRIASTGALSAWARLVMICQVVPSTELPDLNACTSLV